MFYLLRMCVELSIKLLLSLLLTCLPITSTTDVVKGIDLANIIWTEGGMLKKYVFVTHVRLP